MLQPNNLVSDRNNLFCSSILRDDLIEPWNTTKFNPNLPVSFYLLLSLFWNDAEIELVNITKILIMWKIQYLEVQFLFSGFNEAHLSVLFISLKSTVKSQILSFNLLLNSVIKKKKEIWPCALIFLNVFTQNFAVIPHWKKVSDFLTFWCEKNNVNKFYSIQKY